MTTASEKTRAMCSTEKKCTADKKLQEKLCRKEVVHDHQTKSGWRLDVFVWWTVLKVRNRHKYGCLGISSGIADLVRQAFCLGHCRVSSPIIVATVQISKNFSETYFPMKCARA